MFLIRFSPFSDVQSVRHQLDRLFEDLTNAANLEEHNLWSPAVEIIDQEDKLTIKVCLPGIQREDIDVTATRHTLSISGEHQYSKSENEDKYYHSEFTYGKFVRNIKLPVPIQNDKVSAALKDGILTLTLPKVESMVDKAIKVKLEPTVT
ncbi:MAG: Hsp20/alpha crystallin family protein [Synechococcaceae cyanobacterium RL_1_2]|nr:Hsp20/alpha crystallin family protein [Synechococcaceae cyanobacterium RL_1_2]